MPDPPSINLKNILKAEIMGKLSPVDNDFYVRAQKQIKDLEEDLKKSEYGSLKYLNIEDDYNSAKIDYEKIVELRMSKINREALIRKSSRQKDKPEPEGMTPEEVELYKSLLGQMSKWRDQRLDLIYAKMRELPKHEPMIVKTPEVKKSDITKDYVLVRARINVPTFAGMDGRNYTLTKEDVVTVPAMNAKALIARNAAVEIGVRR